MSNNYRVSVRKHSLKSLAEKVAQDDRISKDADKKIVTSLSLKDLRTLTTMLKVAHEKETVRVTTSSKIDKKTLDTIKKQFGGKRILRSVRIIHIYVECIHTL